MYWNNYQLAYKGEFSSIGNHVKSSIDYKVEIYKKYIQGNPPIVKSLTFGKNPCIISFLDDEMAPGIKGCEITLNILNIDNQLPLSTFYSDSDDEWKIIITTNIANEFQGFLIQDTCEEIQTDIAHEITLRFTDGLGLLKSIPFDQAWKLTASSSTFPRKKLCLIKSKIDELPPNVTYPIVEYTTAYFIIYNAGQLNMQQFDTLYIKVLDSNINYSSYNGIYTINKIKLYGRPNPISGIYNYAVYVNEPITINNTSNAILAEICCITPNNINYSCKLKHILKTCLHNTGIKLDTYISSKLLLNTTSSETDEIFEYVSIEPNSFSDNGKYMSCYDVLDNLLTRFNFTIFQGFYRWNIFRFYEKRFMPSFSGYRYNYYFDQYFPSSGIDGSVIIGNYRDIEYGLINTIIRPFSFIIDKYNFEQRDKLIINGDFNETGSVFGNLRHLPPPYPIVYRAWQSKYWTRQDGTIPENAFILEQYINNDAFIKYNKRTRFINIDKISDLSEIDIYYLKSSDIEINAGDEIEVSFSFSTDMYYTNGKLAMRFPVILRNANTTWYLSNILGPSGNLDGFTTNIAGMYKWSIDTTTNIFSVTMRGISPSDGLLNIYLPRGIDQYNSNPAGLFMNPDLAYKDFKISITPFIIGNSTTINQYNKTLANLSLKNNLNIDSYISDSPKNFTQGCLYINSIYTTDGIKVRCNEWKENAFSSFYTIQRVMSVQKMANLYKNRQKIEGKYLAATEVYTDFITTYDRILNPAFFAIFPNFYPGKKFVFGKMDINLKENNCDFTAYEISSSDDPVNNLDSVFNNLFNYTYQTK